MKRKTDLIEPLLATTSSSEMRALLNSKDIPLKLPQAQKLSRHLQGMNEDRLPIKIGIVHTYTSDLLDPWLHFQARLQGLDAELYHAPYGVTMIEAQPGSGLANFQPELTLLLLQWTDLHPDLAHPLTSLSAQSQTELVNTAGQQLKMLLKQFRSVVPGQILLSLLPELAPASLGEFDRTSALSEQAWKERFKLNITQIMRDELPATLWWDMDQSLAEIGRKDFFDLRFWYASRFPFTPTAARELSRRIIATASVIKHPKAKVIVLDADNTLWGGIVGEDGLSGIAIGPDYPGNGFLAFQRRLLDYQQRGFILAMCSKNNPDDVSEVLRDHPHQLLREQHFAALRVNWEPKPQNLRSLSEELNVGLDSFIFVDDSDYECLAVRRELPMIEVVQTPKKPVNISRCLDHVARLEVLTLTAEDQNKTQMYTEQRQRSELANDSNDMASYLASLNMEMSIGIDDGEHLQRLAQLTQKTNQFNLTTRRYSEDDMHTFIASDNWIVAHFSLKDIFGDSGIVGLALIEITTNNEARLDNLLMSCRVIGRQAESAFINALLHRLSDMDINIVNAQFLPTAKNNLVKNFLTTHGFSQIEGQQYLRNLKGNPATATDHYPIDIKFTKSANE